MLAEAKNAAKRKTGNASSGLGTPRPHTFLVCRSLTKPAGTICRWGGSSKAQSSLAHLVRSPSPHTDDQSETRAASKPSFASALRLDVAEGWSCLRGPGTRPSDYTGGIGSPGMKRERLVTEDTKDVKVILPVGASLGSQATSARSWACPWTAQGTMPFCRWVLALVTRCGSHPALRRQA